VGHPVYSIIAERNLQLPSAEVAFVSFDFFFKALGIAGFVHGLADVVRRAFRDRHRLTTNYAGDSSEGLHHLTHERQLAQLPQAAAHYNKGLLVSYLVFRCGQNAFVFRPKTTAT
jgi:hypothetical protein